MRTTLTLDDDLAKELERRRRERGTSLKEEVNGLIRLGLLREREAPLPRRRDGLPFRTWATGPSLVGPLDDVHGVLDRIDPPQLPE
jgi:hypothetical protein